VFTAAAAEHMHSMQTSRMRVRDKIKRIKGQWHTSILLQATRLIEVKSLDDRVA
jgi:hypothetical protein